MSSLSAQEFSGISKTMVSVLSKSGKRESCLLFLCCWALSILTGRWGCKCRSICNCSTSDISRTPCSRDNCLPLAAIKSTLLPSTFPSISIQKIHTAAWLLTLIQGPSFTNQSTIAFHTSSVGSRKYQIRSSALWMDRWEKSKKCGEDFFLTFLRSWEWAQ